MLEQEIRRNLSYVRCGHPFKSRSQEALTSLLKDYGKNEEAKKWLLAHANDLDETMWQPTDRALRNASSLNSYNEYRRKKEEDVDETL